MIKNTKYRTGCLLLGLVSLSQMTFAAPIVVEGVVPDQSSKQAILNKMQAVYGADQVIDQIQVGAVSAPQGWSDSVNKVITPDLKKIKQGQLNVKGTQITLTGKMTDPNALEPTASLFQTLVSQPYRLNTQLSVNQAEQKIIDDALRNRIIEFESGSAILTETGQKILDEMAVALNKVSGKKVKIIGHTDSQGDANKNLQLSQERAIAVQTYLVSKNISVERLSTEGKGANQPIADNTTVEGRKKNRRIEFEVL